MNDRPRRIWVEVLVMWSITAVAIRAAVSLGLSDTWISIIKSLALIYLPVALLLRTRQDLDRFGLHLEGLRESLVLAAVVSLVTLIPFWGANHLWETVFLHHRFHLRFPPDLGSLAAGEVLAVALPEEVFYRGYLQTRLDDALVGRRRILGADVGWALPVASMIFVAGHLAVRPALWELAIFFPALVFGWMRTRSRGLLAPILYHALCNLGMLVLQRSYS